MTSDAPQGVADLPLDDPVWDLFQRCVQCGLCNAACATYLASGAESDSPRGRIAILQRSRFAGRASGSGPGSSWQDCLTCGACEAACPYGVPVATLLTQGRGVRHVAGRVVWREGLRRLRLAWAWVRQSARRLRRAGAT